MRFIIFLLAALLLSSCGTDVSQSLFTELECPKVQFENEYTVQKQNPLRLRVPDSIPPGFNKWAFFNDSLLVSAYTFQDKSALNLYNLPEEKFYNKIRIPQHILGGGIAGLCFLNPDSLLIIQSYPLQMGLINGAGDYIQSYKEEIALSELDTAGRVQQEIVITYPGTAFYANPIYDSNNDEVYVNIHPSGAEIMNGYECVPRIGVYNLKENRWSRFIAAPEGVMKLKESLCYDHEFSIPYFNVVDNKLYISWPMDHYIYIYNAQTAEYIEKRVGCSSIGEALTAPKPVSKMKNREVARQFRQETNFYSPLYYHKDLDLFSRIYYFKTECKKIEGQRVTSPRKSVLIFLDKSLNTVGEQVFENGEFPVTGTFQSSDGFVRNVPYEEQEDNFLIFDKYVIHAL